MDTRKQLNIGKLARAISFDRAAIDAEARTVELAFSSETPVERWFGIEILDHSPQSVDVSRLGNIPLLLDHNPEKLIGTIENITIGADRVGRAVARFGRSELAEEAFRDMQDGIRPSISVGYEIHEMKLEGSGSNVDTYRATKWSVLEISSVAVPADPRVGLGRAAEGSAPVTVILADRAEETQDASQTPEQPNTEIIVMTQEIEQKARDDAQKAERQRVSEIIAMGEAYAKYGADKLAREFINSGKGVDDFRAAILDNMGKQAPAQTLDIELTNNEKRQYSYARAIAAALDMVEGRNASGFEAEVSQELEKKLPSSYKRNGGIFVPLSLQRAPVSTALYNTSGKGAEAVFTEPGDLIELLRNRSVAVELGARILSGLQGPVSFPKQSGANTGYWVAENSGTDVTAGNATLASVSLSPKTLQASTAYSRQLLAQATFDVEAFIRGDLAAVHALAWDKAVLHGAGASNEPDGLYHLSGVNSVAMGGVPTFGKLVDMVTEVAKDNALNGSLAFVTTPGMAGKLSQTVVAASTDTRMIWGGSLTDGNVAGYRGIASNQVSAVLGGGSNEHGILFGNWEEILIGLWGSLEIVVDPYALKKQGMVEITSFQMVDIAARHAESFCKATGATLA